MSQSAVSMELSCSFVSWINDQMRVEIEDRYSVQKTEPRVNFFRSFVVAGVASISFVLASMIVT